MFDPPRAASQPALRDARGRSLGDRSSLTFGDASAHVGRRLPCVALARAGPEVFRPDLIPSVGGPDLPEFGDVESGLGLLGHLLQHLVFIA